ncbi:MAG: hypothetical protein K9J16_14895 [Melioribacteraceae bacterium]|nr:hypothetical protein [Melioribacteraceae bacterium]MCF8356248.1 hypothetical protein [Melioribacteraceae bacterium]MCF8395432.1 hypothetical protein [Melioribacteraceae bacterium]MCF8420767.1 hypothetical protein [Melioribacteraceae bacterium]
MKWSIQICAVICLIVLYFLTEVESGEGQQGRDTKAQQLDEFWQGVPHATFKWRGAEGISERGAIWVPVKLGEEEGWLQLDTGLDVTLLYGEIACERGWEEQGGMYHVPNLEIGDIELGPMWFHSRTKIPTADGLLGSLGLDVLWGRMLVIDYPGKRLALMTPGEMPGWFLERISWTPAVLRDGKFFPYVSLADSGVEDMFFDTGSSAFSIIVDRAFWIELTGCHDPENAATRHVVNSWGNAVTAIGEPAKGPLVVGSVRIQRPEVFYIEENPKLFEQWPFPTRGLIGNAPFWDRVVVVDLGLRPRLGIVQ